MQVEISTAISVGAAIFAAGGGWYLLHSTAKSARSQGIRLGKVEKELAELRGEKRARTKTAPLPTPPEE